MTCKNRISQISKTLFANLDDNKENKNGVEFILVDFGSNDGLQEWILSNFKKELEEGYLKYFYTDALLSWHAAVAKNTSHYYGTGEFLINLDSDNLTGDRGGAHVYNQFLKYGHKLVYHEFDGDFQGGSHGRIGMHKKYFHKIGGYNEAFDPVGYEDMDLINRLNILGLEYRRFTDIRYTRAFKNTRAESVENSDTPYSWGEMEMRNLRWSRSNLYAGKILANDGIFGIRKNVYTYRGGQMTLAVD